MILVDEVENFKTNNKKMVVKINTIILKEEITLSSEFD